MAKVTMSSPFAAERLRTRAAALHMRDLIEGLLRFSRAGAVGSDDDRPLPLRVAVDQALANLATAIQESGAQIAIADDLPMVRYDGVHLAQVVQNLVGNAITYRDPARPLRIRIAAEGREQDAHIIAIADNGPGIAPELRERIFGMFERGHGAGPAGAGIGLALCRKILAARGGRIWVDAAPGGGAVFRFTLPDAGIGSSSAMLPVLRG